VENILQIDGLRKAFGAGPVLKNVSLTLGSGTILGLCGGNGAGKSTLANCIAGHLPPDAGEIHLSGSVAMVPQEFKLVSSLNVFENMFLGREIRTRRFFSDKKAMRRRAAEALLRIGADVSPDAPVAGLSVALKQKVEIAKALLLSPSLLIMDEPTAVLNAAEAEVLFGILRAFSAGGGSVVFVSHRLREVCELCDEVAVMRDGKLVFRAPAASLAPADIAEQMTGIPTRAAEARPQLGESGENAARARPAALEAVRVSSGREVRDVSFVLREGEVLGLAGLAGAGRTELAEALCGLRHASGEIRVGGAAVRVNSMLDAMRCGLAYLSEDRQGTALLPAWSVADNATLSSLPRHAGRAGFIRRAECRAAARGYVDAFKIKTSGIEAAVSTLSGGNQQKVAIAKGLDTNPKVFIFDEPTRGVDVAARAEIYGFIHALAARGTACLLISSDFEEIVANCARVLVMRAGALAGELSGAEVSERNLMLLAAGAEEAR
jgi:ABC-type sugar transport system, ATPase component